ncbi:MAG: hypothetical protein K0R59_570 [Sphingobacterium sp.]|jgi:hypothetical protein|nr:hypothetical protein [Sphingobacterium sp.]
MMVIRGKEKLDQQESLVYFLKLAGLLHDQR